MNNPTGPFTILELENPSTTLGNYIKLAEFLMMSRTGMCRPQLFPVLIGRESNCEIALYTIFSFFHQMIYL